MVHSRCVLIVFSICGLFSIIVLWLLSSVSCSFFESRRLTWGGDAKNALFSS